MNAENCSVKTKLIRCMAALAIAITPAFASAASQAPGKGVSVTPIFPTIAEERFRGEIAMAGLKDLGYNVQQPKVTDYPAMMLALSYGDADFTVHAWEQLHAAFYAKAGGDDTMVKVGSILPGVL